MRILSSIKKNPHLWPLSMMLLVVVVLYGRLVGHEFMYNWDDDYYVIRNVAVHGFSWDHIRNVFTSFYVGNYAPVQMLSYLFDYSLWGLWPGGYYLTNISFHLANTILLYLLLLRQSCDRLIAWCAAVIFMVHPVQVETVAWVSQRKNLLAMFFFLLAWLAYCIYQETSEVRGRFAYAVSLIFFALALLSKSVVVIFPLVLVLYDVCFLPRDRRVALKDKVPFIIASGLFAVVSIYAQQPVDDGWMGQGGGAVSLHGGSSWATFCTMLIVLCRYVGMTLWPVDLSLLYFPSIHRSFDLPVVAAALLLVVLGLLGIRLYRTDRRLGFYFLFFWVGLLPVSQIIPLITLMNDRYLYFPVIGAAALYGAGAAYLRDRITGRPMILAPAIIVPVVLLVVLSSKRVATWQHPVTAWSDTVAKNPYTELPLHKLGEAYQYAQPPRYQDALATYLRVTEMNPASHLSWFQVGIIYSALGDYENSITALKTFLELKRDHVMGRAALGYSYQMKGDYSAAEKEYNLALALQPDAIQLQGMLGSLALAQGDLRKARGHFLRAEDAWHDPESAFHLACVESLAGHGNESLDWLEKALQRGYDDWRNLNSAPELAKARGQERFAVLVQHYASRSNNRDRYR